MTTYMQASTDGSLVVLSSRLSKQPQIASAYTKQAPMRFNQMTDLKAALQPLQVDHTVHMAFTTVHALLVNKQTISPITQ